MYHYKTHCYNSYHHDVSIADYKSEYLVITLKKMSVNESLHKSRLKFIESCKVPNRKKGKYFTHSLMPLILKMHAVSYHSYSLWSLIQPVPRQCYDYTCMAEECLSGDIGNTSITVPTCNSTTDKCFVSIITCSILDSQSCYFSSVAFLSHVL